MPLTTRQSLPTVVGNTSMSAEDPESTSFYNHGPAQSIPQNEPEG